MAIVRLRTLDSSHRLSLLLGQITWAHQCLQIFISSVFGLQIIRGHEIITFKTMWNVKHLSHYP